MIVTRVADRLRNDIWVDTECKCGHREERVSGYDDSNWWDNVLPRRVCPVCNRSEVEYRGEA